MQTLSTLAVILLSGSSIAPAHTVTATASPLTTSKAPAGARIFIISPKDGATVGQEVTIKFGASGIAIEPAGLPKPDSGHHHLLIDVDALPPPGTPIPSDARHKHYGKAQTQDTIHLQPGTHTLQLILGNGLHMPFDPPLVTNKITIHVK